MVRGPSTALRTFSNVSHTDITARILDKYDKTRRDNFCELDQTNLVRSLLIKAGGFVWL
jgi:hypothetical protein